MALWECEVRHFGSAKCGTWECEVRTWGCEVRHLGVRSAALGGAKCGTWGCETWEFGGCKLLVWRLKTVGLEAMDYWVGG